MMYNHLADKNSYVLTIKRNPDKTPGIPHGKQPVLLSSAHQKIPYQFGTVTLNAQQIHALAQPE